MNGSNAADDQEKVAPSPELVVQNREVQRLLGRCLIRIQHVERVLKVIVAGHHVFGSGADTAEHMKRRAADVAKLGLGDLVDLLLEDVIHVPAEGCNADADADLRPAKRKSKRSMSKTALLVQRQARGALKANGAGLPWFVTTVRFTTQAQEATAMGKRLQALVKLRNRVVHHFSDEHDLRTLVGCDKAIALLAEAETHLMGHLEELQRWAASLAEAQQVGMRALTDPAIQERMFSNDGDNTSPADA